MLDSAKPPKERRMDALPIVLTLGVYAAALSCIYCPRIDLAHRPILSLGLVVISLTGESLFHLDNARFAAALVVLLTLLREPTRLVQKRATDLLVMSLFLVSGPLVMALVPFAWWHYARTKAPDVLARALVVTVAGIAHGLVAQSWVGIPPAHVAVALVVIWCARRALWATPRPVSTAEPVAMVRAESMKA